MKKQRNKMELFSIRQGVATRHHWFDRTGATSYDVDAPLMSGFRSKAKATAAYKAWKTTAAYKEWEVANGASAAQMVYRPENTMTKRKVNRIHRAGFTPKVFGTKYIRNTGYSFVVGESLVFDHASTLVEEYADGSGYWEFYTVSNGAMFMAPSTDKKLMVENIDNYFSAEMSAEALGIVATIFALSRMLHLTMNERFVGQIDLLKDYAEQLPESALIFQAID